MTGRASTWNSLSSEERYILLRTARPGGSTAIIMYEIKLPWRALLPSTQIELSEIQDWPTLLGWGVYA